MVRANLPIDEILKDKEIHVNLAVRSQTTEALTAMWEEWSVMMEKALTLWVEVKSRLVLIDINRLLQRTLSLYQEFSKECPQISN